MILYSKYLLISLVIIGGNLNIFAQDCKAHLTIKSDIENIIVFVDDTLAGSGNTVDIELDLGFHIIVAAENSDRWDAITFIDTLNVKDCKDLFLKYKFSSDVLLNSDPQDVHVFSNDSLIGYTPLMIPMGLNNIRLEKPGYETTMVDYSDFDRNQPVHLNFTGEIDDGNFFDKTLFKVLVGSMLALGAATAYFKLEADNKFDEYLITGDDELLAQTDRLDTISAVTFVALQINFGLIIYFFLVD